MHALDVLDHTASVIGQVHVLVTVSTQALRAATTNPVDTLRYE